MIISKVKRTLRRWLFFQPPVNAHLMRQLGYSHREKLLIIHADDLGLSQSHNNATMLAMNHGLVNSASLMMPCKYALDAIQTLKDYPTMDIGVHLTLTCEWDKYKWGSLSPGSEVPSILDKNGYMYPDCSTFAAHADPEEVEVEMRTQIRACISAGIMPSHLDTHMGCMLKGRPEYLVSYLKLGKEFGIPAMIRPEVLEVALENHRDLFHALETEDLLTVDRIAIASEKLYELKGMNWFYSNYLKTLRRGINVLLIHPAFDDEEMKSITSGHRYWNAAWRQADFDFFTSPQTRNVLDQLKIKLISWKEINAAKLDERNTKSPTPI